MLIIIGCFLISLFIGLLTCEWDIKSDFFPFLVTSFLCNLVMLIIYTIIWTSSYDSYLDMKKFYNSTKEQYTSSINIYEDKAVLTISEDTFITDMKYQGYQANILELIKDLRKKIVIYNETLVGKNTMKQNLFFNWFIVSPDPDMKIMILKEEFSKNRKE